MVGACIEQAEAQTGIPAPRVDYIHLNESLASNVMITHSNSVTIEVQAIMLDPAPAIGLGMALKILWWTVLPVTYGRGARWIQDTLERIRRHRQIKRDYRNNKGVNYGT